MTYGSDYLCILLMCDDLCVCVREKARRGRLGKWEKEGELYIVCTVGELVCIFVGVCLLYTRIFLHVSAMLLYACLYMCAGVQLSIYLM